MLDAGEHPHIASRLIIGSYALQGRHAFIYIRGSLICRTAAGAAIEKATSRTAGWHPGTGYSCDVVLYRGAGSYVCGEASACPSLEAEGWPRNRPRLTVKGVPEAHRGEQRGDARQRAGDHQLGATEFKKVGTPKSPGTQMISISGHVVRPGVYEVEYGYSWEKFIYEDCGGMLGGRALKCIIPGGVSTKVLNAEELKGVTLDHNSALAAGSQLGSGGMIAVAEGTCMVRLARRDPALLSPRVVRPVHPVPRRHGMDGADPQAHRGRWRSHGRHRPPLSDR
jgi:NADH-quinone oxidoreductase subunit F